MSRNIVSADAAKEWMKVGTHSRIATSVVKDLAFTVIALATERDEARRLHVSLRAALDAETGKAAPGDWTRNDIDPKREGIAWYRRWEADGSKPGDDDTEQTRVAWVRHDPEAMTTWCWEIEAPTLGVFGKQIAHGEGFDNAYEAMEACDEYAEIEAMDRAAPVTK